MHRDTDYEQMFHESISPKKRLKLFANSLAQLESERKIKPKRVLINGMFPAEDVFTAHYVIPKDDAGQILDHFLAVQDLDPDVIINGKPGLPVDVLVNVGRQARAF